MWMLVGSLKKGEISTQFSIETNKTVHFISLSSESDVSLEASIMLK